MTGLSTEFLARRKCGQLRCCRCGEWVLQEERGQYLCRSCDRPSSTRARPGSGDTKPLETGEDEWHSPK